MLVLLSAVGLAGVASDRERVWQGVREVEDLGIEHAVARRETQGKLGIECKHDTKENSVAIKGKNKITAQFKLSLTRWGQKS